MSRQVLTCERTTPLDVVARKMVEGDCGMIPIVDENDHPIGAVTDRDITCRSVAKRLDPRTLTAGDVMTSPCVTVPENAPIKECARILGSQRIRRAVVVDSGGQCVGVISQADLAQKALGDRAGELVRQVSQPTESASRVS